MYYKSLPLSDFTSRIDKEMRNKAKSIATLEKKKREERNLVIASLKNKKRGRTSSSPSSASSTSQSGKKKKKSKTSKNEENKTKSMVAKETRIMELRSWSNQFTPGMKVHLLTTFKDPSCTAWFPAIVLEKNESSDGISIECRHRHGNTMDTVMLKFEANDENAAPRRIVKSDRVEELVWTPIRHGKKGIMWWPSQIVSDEVIQNPKVIKMKKKAEKIASKSGDQVKLVFFLGSNDWGWLPSLDSIKSNLTYQSASPLYPNPNGEDYKNSRKSWQAAVDALNILRSITWKKMYEPADLEKKQEGDTTLKLKRTWAKTVDRNIEVFKSYVMENMYECEHGCGFEHYSKEAVEVHEATCTQKS